LARIIIVYESKYGNTRLVAETISQGMREVPGIEVLPGELPKCRAFGAEIAKRLTERT